MFRIVSATLLVLFVGGSLAVAADDGPAKDVPQLAALANYVGTWDVAVTSQDFPFSKGEATAKWILDGRFVQQSSSLAAADGKASLSMTTLLTYDTQEGVYRMWSFLSDGETFQTTGTWDEKARTMTSVRRGGGTTTTITARFNDNTSEDWSIVTTNDNNEVVNKFSGKNTRRK